MVDLKLNKKRLAMHWHYYYWKYVAFIAAALMAANFLVTATVPKAPAERRVDVIIIGGTGASTDRWQNDILRMLPPDQQEVSVTATTILEGQESTMYQLVAARMAAGEGNIWIMPKDYFLGNAAGGTFIPLDGMVSAFAIPEGADLSAGKVALRTEDGSPGETHLFGIPLDKCTGLAELFWPEDMVLAIPVYATKNTANTIATANWILAKTNEPQLLDQLKPAEKVEIPVIALSFRAGNADAWQAELLKALGSGTQAVSIPLGKYHVGRETFTADGIASDIKKGVGTAWIVPKDVFVPLARAGVLRALDDELAAYRIPEGADLSLGKEAAVSDGKPGEPRQYGIPLDQCAALSKLTVPDGMMLVFPAWKNLDFNYENARAAANWILTTDLAPEKEPAGTSK
jgi:hypothetical protein